MGVVFEIIGGLCMIYCCAFLCWFDLMVYYCVCGVRIWKQKITTQHTQEHYISWLISNKHTAATILYNTRRNNKKTKAIIYYMVQSNNNNNYSNTPLVHIYIDIQDTQTYHALL